MDSAAPEGVPVRNLVLVLLLCVVGGVGLFFLLSGDDVDDATDVGTGPGGDGEIVGEGPILEGSGDGLVDSPGARAARERAASHRARFEGGHGELVVRVKADGAPAKATVQLFGVLPYEEGGIAEALGAGPSAFFDLIIGEGNTHALATKKTDDSGVARFTDVGPGIYMLLAKDEAGNSGTLRSEVPRDGARIAVDLPLSLGGSPFSGRVEYDDGTPFRGLLYVGSTSAMGGMGPIGPIHGTPVALAADGSFTATGLPDGPVTVTALLPGAMRLMDGTGSVPQSGEYRLVVPRTGDGVSGRVIDGVTKEAIEGARVLAGQGGGQTSFRVLSTWSDAEGGFEIPMQLTGSGGLFVMAKGYAAYRLESESVPGGEIVVPLTPAGSIRGRVLTEGGESVGEGVTVFLQTSDRQSGGFPMLVRTDAEGSYAVEDVPAGPAQATVRGGGYLTPGGPGEGIAIQVASGETVEADLVVTRAGRLQGNVLAPDGSPVSGAFVMIEGEGDAFGFMFRMMSRALGGSAGEGTVTDANGAFVLDTVQPGVAARVRATTIDYPPATRENVVVASGETQEIELRFETGRHVELSVVSDKTGKGIAGASVFWRLAPEEEADDMMGGMETAFASGVQTDGRGIVRIGPIGDGVLQVRAKGPGHLEVDDWTDVEIRGTGDLVRAEFRMRAGLVVAGRIALPEDLPYDQVTMHLNSESMSMTENFVWEQLSVASDGSFRIDTLPPGRFEVSVEGRVGVRKWRAQVIVQAPDENLQIELEELEPGEDAMLIRIVDAAGEAVAGGRITVATHLQGYEMSAGGSFAQGRYLAEADENLPAGVGTVWIHISGLSDPALGGGSFGPFASNQAEVEIQLAPAGSIEGRVLGEDGAGIAGATVAATSIYEIDGEVHEGNVIASAVTDGQGAFELPGVGSGRFRIAIQSGAKGLLPDPVVATSGQRGVELRVRAGVSAQVTVNGPDGRPLSGAHVSASVAMMTDLWDRLDWQQLNRLQRDAVTDSHGIALLEGLDPEIEYSLTVQHGSGRYTQVEVESWTPKALTVKLEAAHGIAGIVRTTSGEPVDGATVWYRPGDDEEGAWNGVETDRGRFEIEGLGVGEFLLRVTPPGVASHVFFDEEENEDLTLRVRAGDQEVEFVVDLGLQLRVEVADYAGGDHEVHLIWTGEWGEQSAEQTLSQDGHATFARLDEDTRYKVLVVGLPEGKYAQAEDVSPTVGTVVLQPQTGVSVKGTVVFADDGRPARDEGIQVQGEHIWMWQMTNRNGEFVVEGLPPGIKLTVQAWVSRGDKTWTGEQEVESGGTVSIKLKPQEEDE